MDGSKDRKIPAGLGVWLVIPDFEGTFCRGGGGRKSGCVGAKEMEAAHLSLHEKINFSNEFFLLLGSVGFPHSSVGKSW